MPSSKFAFMKKILLSALFIIPLVVSAQFEQGLKAGNSDEVSKYLANIVKVNWMGEESNMSSLNLTNSFKTFFETCDGAQLRIIHKGESDAGLHYSMAELSCSEKNYDLTYYYTSQNGFEVVEEFSIEEK